jgi:hypothetical protein
VAVTVNVKLPDAVGVPERTPAEESTSPEGNAPPVTANVCGARPPDAVNVWLYGVPCTPPTSAAGKTVTVAHVILVVYVRLPEHSLASVAVTVKVYVPGVVGLPERDPVVDRLKPGGSDPEVRTNVYGAVPPEAEKVLSNGSPTAPLEIDAGESVITGHPEVIVTV